MSAADFEYVNSSTSSNGLTADNVRSELLHPYEVTCSHTLVQSSTPVMIVLAALICSTSLDAYSTQPAQRRSWRRKYPRASWLPSWNYARGKPYIPRSGACAASICSTTHNAHGVLLQAMDNSLPPGVALRCSSRCCGPVIVGVTYGLGHQSFIDCYMVHTAPC